MSGERRRKVSSCALHPFPGGIVSDHQPEHQKRGGPEHSGVELLIEPTTQENADQHGHDDDPAEYADLGEPACNRWFALAQPALVAFAAQPNPFNQRILFVWFSFGFGRWGLLRRGHESIALPPR